MSSDWRIRVNWIFLNASKNRSSSSENWCYCHKYILAGYSTIKEEHLKIKHILVCGSINFTEFKKKCVFLNLKTNNAVFEKKSLIHWIWGNFVSIMFSLSLPSLPFKYFTIILYAQHITCFTQHMENCFKLIDVFGYCKQSICCRCCAI